MHYGYTLLYWNYAQCYYVVILRITFIFQLTSSTEVISASKLSDVSTTETLCCVEAIEVSFYNQTVS